MDPVRRFLPLLVYAVNYCPQNETEWKIASEKLKCSFEKLENRYHCVPDEYRSTLLQFCYDTAKILVKPGHCLEIADSFTLNYYKCSEKFKSGCPNAFYFSDEIYLYPACTAIDPVQGCFLSETQCGETTSATDTTTEATTYQGYPDIIIAISCFAFLVTIVAVVFFVSYLRRRRCPGNRRGENIHDIYDNGVNERLLMERRNSETPRRKSKSDMDLQIKKTEQNRIVVAIDIGTTYSGYSYSFYKSFIDEPLNSVHCSWVAGSAGLISLKTPTTILLSSKEEFMAFGYEAEDYYSNLAESKKQKDCFYFTRFKMSLFEQKKMKNLMLKDVTGKELPAMTVFTLSIRYLKKHFEDTLQNRGHHLNRSEINWVLSVPAIWNDSAKKFMIDAAVQAGIQQKHLTYCPEPDAVSLYCKYLPLQKREHSSSTCIHTLRPQQRYIVLDAGGGTVDMTVYEMQLNGLLKEIEKANGGPWGGIEVDKKFKKMLEDIIGEPYLVGYRKEFPVDYLDLLRRFEIEKRKIKTIETGTVTIPIPVSLLEKCKERGTDLNKLISRSAYKNEVEIDMDKIRISIVQFGQFFDSVFSEIINHTKQLFQRKKVRGTEIIVMVGGFSESELLQNKIKASFPRCTVHIPQEGGLAVLKGSVIFGHQPHSFPFSNIFNDCRTL